MKFLFILLVLSLCCFIHLHAEAPEYKWNCTKGSPNIKFMDDLLDELPDSTRPGPRAFHLAVHDRSNDAIIIYGGAYTVDTNHSIFKLNYTYSDVWSFDITTMGWNQLFYKGAWNYNPVEDIPGGRAGMAGGFFYPSGFWFFGGLSIGSSGIPTLHNDFWVFNPNLNPNLSEQEKNDQFIEIKPKIGASGEPAARYGHVTLSMISEEVDELSLKHKMYIYGGITSLDPIQINSDLWFYDFETSIWELRFDSGLNYIDHTLLRPPSFAFGGLVTTLQNKLHTNKYQLATDYGNPKNLLFLWPGYVNTNNITYLDEISGGRYWGYNETNDEWSITYYNEANLEVTAGFGYTYLEDGVFTFGGRTYNKVLNRDGYVYTDTMNKSNFSSSTTYPYYRAGHSLLFIPPDTVFLFGGADNHNEFPDGGTYDDVWTYAPSSISYTCPELNASEILDLEARETLVSLFGDGFEISSGCSNIRGAICNIDCTSALGYSQNAYMKCGYRKLTSSDEPSWIYDGFCGSCLYGQYVSDGYCETCTDGNYTGVLNATSCSFCPNGTYTKEIYLEKQCAICPKGSYCYNNIEYYCEDAFPDAPITSREFSDDKSDCVYYYTKTLNITFVEKYIFNTEDSNFTTEYDVGPYVTTAYDVLQDWDSNSFFFKPHHGVMYPSQIKIKIVELPENGILVAPVMSFSSVVTPQKLQINDYVNLGDTLDLHGLNYISNTLYTGIDSFKIMPCSSNGKMCFWNENITINVNVISINHPPAFNQTIYPNFMLNILYTGLTEYAQFDSEAFDLEDNNIEYFWNSNYTFSDNIGPAIPGQIATTAKFDGIIQLQWTDASKESSEINMDEYWLLYNPNVVNDGVLPYFALQPPNTPFITFNIRVKAEIDPYEEQIRQMILSNLGSNYSDTLTIHIYIQCQENLNLAVWTVNTENNDNTNVCQVCPIGAVCTQDGSRFPISQSGYWDAGANIFLACSPAEACPQGADANLCTVGYEGRRCGTCAIGYYRLSGKCVACPPDESNVLLWIIGGLVIGIVLLLLMWVATKGPRMGFASIAITYMQSLDIVSNIKLKWPTNVNNAFSFMSFFNLNIELLSVECKVQTEWGWKQKYVAVVITPLIFVLLLFIALILMFIKLTLTCDKEFCKKLKEFKNLIIKSYILFLVFFYISLSSTVVEIFDCTQMVDGSYLDADPSLKCYEEEWNNLLGVGILGLLFYCFGIPAFFFFILLSKPLSKHSKPWCCCRCPVGYNIKHHLLSSDIHHRYSALDKEERKVLKHETNDWIRKYGILTINYCPRAYYWELMIMIRKVLISFAKIFASLYPMIQACVSILIFFFSFLFQLYYEPYADKILNQLEFVSLFSSIMLLIGGMLCYGEQAIYEDETKRELLGAIMILFFVSTFVIIFIHMAKAFMRSYTLWKQGKPRFNQIEESSIENPEIDDVVPMKELELPPVIQEEEELDLEKEQQLRGLSEEDQKAILEDELIALQIEKQHPELQQIEGEYDIVGEYEIEGENENDDKKE